MDFILKAVETKQCTVSCYMMKPRCNEWMPVSLVEAALDNLQTNPKRYFVLHLVSLDAWTNLKRELEQCKEVNFKIEYCYGPISKEHENLVLDSKYEREHQLWSACVETLQKIKTQLRSLDVNVDALFIPHANPQWFRHVITTSDDLSSLYIHVSFTNGVSLCQQLLHI